MWGHCFSDGTPSLGLVSVTIWFIRNLKALRISFLDCASCFQSSKFHNWLGVLCADQERRSYWLRFCVFCHWAFFILLVFEPCFSALWSEWTIQSTAVDGQAIVWDAQDLHRDAFAAASHPCNYRACRRNRGNEKFLMKTPAGRLNDRSTLLVIEIEFPLPHVRSTTTALDTTFFVSSDDSRFAPWRVILNMLKTACSLFQRVIIFSLFAFFSAASWIRICPKVICVCLGCSFVGTPCFQE